VRGQGAREPKEREASVGKGNAEGGQADQDGKGAVEREPAGHEARSEEVGDVGGLSGLAGFLSAAGLKYYHIIYSSYSREVGRKE